MIRHSHLKLKFPACICTKMISEYGTGCDPLNVNASTKLNQDTVYRCTPYIKDTQFIDGHAIHQPGYNRRSTTGNFIDIPMLSNRKETKEYVSLNPITAYSHSKYFAKDTQANNMVSPLPN